jgi:hypothetical protein
LARHRWAAPFACNAPLLLCIELNPFGWRSKHLIVERCGHCGKVVSVTPVLPEEVPVNNDDQDDGA